MKRLKKRTEPTGRMAGDAGDEKKEEAEAEAEPEKEKEDTDSVEGDKKEVEDTAAMEAEDEDDPSYLQLSWEMLELAKMVLLDQLEVRAPSLCLRRARACLRRDCSRLSSLWARSAWRTRTTSWPWTT